MKMYKDIEQRSVDWFALRMGKATGSVADKVVSDSSPFKTLVMQKACEWINQKSVESGYFNDDMQRGIDNENIARMLYEMKTGNRVDHCAFIEYNDYAGYSPDGLVDDDGMIEIKCPRANTHLSYMVGGIPSNYRWQMQFGLFCSGRQWCDFVSFNEDFDDEHKIFTSRFGIDTKAQTKIRTKLMEFENEIKEIIRKYGEL